MYQHLAKADQGTLPHLKTALEQPAEKPKALTSSPNSPDPNLIKHPRVAAEQAWSTGTSPRKDPLGAWAALVAQSGLKEYLAGGLNLWLIPLFSSKINVPGCHRTLLVCCAECIIIEIEEEKPDFNWSDSVISDFQSIAISFSINRGLV